MQRSPADRWLPAAFLYSARKAGSQSTAMRVCVSPRPAFPCSMLSLRISPRNPSSSPKALRRACDRDAAVGCDSHHREPAFIGAVGAEAEETVDAGKAGWVGQDVGRIALAGSSLAGKCCDKRHGIIGRRGGSHRPPPAPGGGGGA